MNPPAAGTPAERSWTAGGGLADAVFAIGLGEAAVQAANHPARRPIFVRLGRFGILLAGHRRSLDSSPGIRLAIDSSNLSIQTRERQPLQYSLNGNGCALDRQIDMGRIVADGGEDRWLAIGEAFDTFLLVQ